MAAVHTAARTVEYLAAVETRTLAERLLGGPRRSGLVRRLEPGGIRLEDGLLVAVTERRTRADIDRLADAMAAVLADLGAAGAQGPGQGGAPAAAQGRPAGEGVAR
jgi:hypothetical protein